MLKIGQAEVDAVGQVAHSGKVFRYNPNGECGRFERRWAEYLGAEHVALCASGTAALTAALAGLKLGPGDEVIVPAHTFMATAIAVLAVGAIPVIVDIDESITLDPAAFEAAIGPCTKAVIPVHLWGALCDMEAIGAIAEAHGLLVIEDACQCVGGFYRGRGAGAVGHAGAYSFNFFKNMTCGEGGAVVTDDEEVWKRARCMIDPCSFYWEGRDDSFVPFVNPGARASEFEGAMLNAQLDRLPELLAALHRQKAIVLEATEAAGLASIPRHDPEGECATSVAYQFDTAARAEAFCAAAGGWLLANTGRHNYTEWDQILTLQGSHHPALNPFTMPANAACRKEYSKDMCPRTLDILNRTVQISLSPEADDAAIEALVGRITAAAGALV